MIRQEDHFNTPEQVREYVAEAAAICNELGVAPTEHPAIYVKVLELVAGKNVTMTAPTPVSLGHMAIPPNRRH